jgi:hypothetical protein
MHAALVNFLLFFDIFEPRQINCNNISLILMCCFCCETVTVPWLIVLKFHFFICGSTDGYFDEPSELDPAELTHLNVRFCFYLAIFPHKAS